VKVPHSPPQKLVIPESREADSSGMTILGKLDLTPYSPQSAPETVEL
jgi:hypothetical protein